MKNAFLLVMTWMLAAGMAAAQQTQVVQGRITDAITKAPLPGAYVSLLTLRGDSLVPSGQGTATDLEGYYRIAGVPVGRVSLRYGMLGYQSRSVINTPLIVGKELVLNIALQEQVQEREEVVIEANKGSQKQLASNEFAFLSARGFDAEETRRYAGSRQDPSRMASNYAGVSGQNDGRNDIVIRGNSPTGLLWRLEGADIFNPSHFGALGATGGPVSMLNNNVLDKSDFLTGAFPAEYGNALAGVFDLQMRSGNTEKHEFLGQIGFNGFELGAEGPLKKGSRASYLVNARYSTLAVVSKLGLQFGTGTAVPYYQDASFKLHLPTAKAGTFSLFGVGGTSHIDFQGKDQDSTNLYSAYYQNTNYRTASGVLGLQHNYQFSKNTWGQAVVSSSLGRTQSIVDSLVADGTLPTYRDKSQNTRQSLRYTVGHRFNSRFSIKTGAYVDAFGLSLNDSLRRTDGRFRHLKDVSGSAWLLQAYVQGLYRITDRISTTVGLHGQRFSLGQTGVVEPRAGVQYGIGRSQLSLAAGLHSQTQPLAGYFVQTQNEAGGYALTNTSLKMTRALHLVAGYSRPINENTRLKVEGYVQRIYNAPVERRATDYSMLNEGANFNYPNKDSLVNKGVGRNIGVELTLERSFAAGYYFLVTGSLFDSRYQGSDGVWHNTAFNGHYIGNILAGKEWSIGAKSVFALDVKFTTAGGRRYTPVDTAASRAQQQEVLVKGEAFTKQLADYLRLDVKLTYRYNGKRASQEFFVDIQNITNRQNPYTQQWDVRRGRLVTTNQLGLFPNVNYRINF